MSQIKQCTKCKIAKNVSEFYKEKHGKYGVRGECKKCRKQYHKAYDQSEHGRKVRRKRLATKEGYESNYGWQRTPDGRASQNRRSREYERKNRDKYLAVRAVNHAVERGDIPRVQTKTCGWPNCDNGAEHYHHESYAKEHRLDVIPYCARHHKARHKQMRGE